MVDEYMTFDEADKELDKLILVATEDLKTIEYVFNFAKDMLKKRRGKLKRLFELKRQLSSQAVDAK